MLVLSEVDGRNYCRGKERVSDDGIIEILTDRFFETNEEELMRVLGWNSIINLWRVQEAIDEVVVDCLTQKE